MDALLTRPPGTEPADTAVAPIHPPADLVADFDICYRQQFPGLVWFVMSLGADAEVAADAAQSAFAAAFPPQLVAADVEFRDEGRQVLAALAALPPGQRQVMAWHVDGFGPAEIARELGTDQAAVRQSLAKARKNLKRLLGISEGCPR